MYCNVMYHAGVVKLNLMWCMIVRLLLDIPLAIVVVFVLPWRQWSLDEEEAALDHHSSAGELDTLKEIRRT